MQAFVRFLILSAFLPVIFSSCRRGVSAPDVSDIDMSIRSHLFFMDVFEGGSKAIEDKAVRLRKTYDGYLEAYCQKVIHIGSSDAAEFPDRLKAFIDYEANQEVYQKCKEQYTEVGDIVSDLDQAFRYYKYYFPQVEAPELYFHISGFNESIAIDSAWVSVSVENYLGEDCQFYQWLGRPQYLLKRMVREKIVPDIIKSMALSSFTVETNHSDVLSSMVENGKVMYFMHQLMPEIEPYLLLDMSDEELAWCRKHEDEIWATMVERKDLFKTDRMVIQKYTGDSPFTYFFGQNSPGKAAVYLGYQIVSAYMAGNGKISLGDLMADGDAHKIFQQSRYRP